MNKRSVNGGGKWQRNSHFLNMAEGRVWSDLHMRRCYTELRFDWRDGNAFRFEEDLRESFDLRRTPSASAESEAEEWVSGNESNKLRHTHKGTLVFSLPDLISVCSQGP